ncbi:MAG: hypothetical protein JWO37_1364 [Acidimicrobiales bacterium]|jgi:hypothetical protein|nr:hypothetical protein [Acidimicrobiales bacterium]
MDLQEFTQAIHEMSVTDIREVAAEIGGHQASVADDIAWWQATLTIDKVLKHDGRCRTAAVAASSASRAVLAIVDHADDSSPDSDVIAVARAAGTIARGLVAGKDVEPCLDHLLRDWQPVLRRGIRHTAA